MWAEVGQGAAGAAVTPPGGRWGAQAVARSTGVETRHAVLRELGVMGTAVFLNCAPFLRVLPFGSEMANMDTQVTPGGAPHPRHSQGYHQRCRRLDSAPDPDTAESVMPCGGPLWYLVASERTALSIHFLIHFILSTLGFEC